MKFNLVDGRGYFASLNNVLNDGDTSIGQPDGLRLALLQHILHLSPGLGLIPVPVEVSRAIGLYREKRVSAIGCKTHRPVNEVEVKVVGLEGFESSIQTFLDTIVVRGPARER